MLVYLKISDGDVLLEVEGAPRAPGARFVFELQPLETNESSSFERNCNPVALLGNRTFLYEVVLYDMKTIYVLDLYHLGKNISGKLQKRIKTKKITLSPKITKKMIPSSKGEEIIESLILSLTADGF